MAIRKMVLAALKRGDYVRILSLGKEGVVRRAVGDTVTVFVIDPKAGSYEAQFPEADLQKAKRVVDPLGGNYKVILPATLAGRAANGWERDAGQKVHAVAGESAQRINYSHGVALCGASPGRRSVGWSVIEKRVTCPKCLRVATERHVNIQQP